MSLAWLLCSAVTLSGGPAPLPVPEFLRTELPATAPTGGLQSERRFYARRVSENGRIPFGAHQRALDQAEQLTKSVSAFGGPEGSASEELLLAWTELGPTNVGGRVRDIVVRPTPGGGGGGDGIPSATLWTISPGGGIWRSTNSGESWTQSQGLPNLNFSVLASSYDASTDQIQLFAGTGEGFWAEKTGLYNISAARGAGIYHSSDEGLTWKLVRNTNLPQFSYIYSLLVHPTNPSVLLASTPNGVYRINRVNTDPRRGFGITRVTTTPLAKMHLVPGTDTVIAGTEITGQVARGPSFGSTWTFSAALGNPATIGRTEVAICEADPTVVYASVNDSQGTSSADDDGDMWRSTDGGLTFAQLPRPSADYLSSGFYAHAVWVSPTNPDHVIVGGLDLRRSTDGGQTWTQISEWERYMANRPFVKQSVHADIHSLVSSPEYGINGESRLWVATDAGVFETSNPITAGVLDWTPRNDGIGITQFYYGSVSPDGGSVIGGTQDNGTIFLLDGESQNEWKTTFPGDGSNAFFSPTNAGVYYTSYVRGRTDRSTTASATQMTPENGASFDFIPKLHYYPGAVPGVGEQLLLCGRTGLFMINPATHPANTAPTQIFNAATDITEVERASFNAEHAWIGGPTLGILKTNTLTDGNQNDWADVTPTGFPSRTVSDIEIVNSNRVYVSLMGYEFKNLWRTSDGGNTWQNLHVKGTLPQVPISSVKVLRSRIDGSGQVDTLAVGTDIGVFISFDSGNTWQASTGGMGTVVVEDLFFDPTREYLYAVTHGRGMFRSSLPMTADLVLAGRGTNLVGAQPVGLTSLFEMSFTTRAGDECTYADYNIGPPNGLAFRFDNAVASPEPYSDSTFADVQFRAYSPDGTIAYRMSPTFRNSTLEARNRVTGVVTPLGTIPILSGYNEFHPKAWDPELKRIYGIFYVFQSATAFQWGYVDFQSTPLQAVALPAFPGMNATGSIHRFDSPIGRYIPLQISPDQQTIQIKVFDTVTQQFTLYASSGPGTRAMLLDATEGGLPLYGIHQVPSTTMDIFLGNQLVANDVPHVYPFAPHTDYVTTANVSGSGDRILITSLRLNADAFNNVLSAKIKIQDVMPNGSLRNILKPLLFGPATYLWYPRLSNDGRSLLFASDEKLTPSATDRPMDGTTNLWYRLRLPPGPL